jgi:hypothetical protein
LVPRYANQLKCPLLLAWEEKYDDWAAEELESLLCSSSGAEANISNLKMAVYRFSFQLLYLYSFIVGGFKSVLQIRIVLWLKNYHINSLFLVYKMF